LSYTSPVNALPCQFNLSSTAVPLPLDVLAIINVGKSFDFLASFYALIISSTE